ncbi:MAG: Hsp33 family molecular chaperone HslO [Lachnospiraceae bacterium]|nr:Hsp33 family molecular chaperone HslO [Lachnospiraceae bacterium]
MSDYIVRGMAAQDQIRFFASTTKELVEHARQIHNSSPVMTAALGRLLTAGGMMGSMLKGGKDTLTLQIRGDGPAKGMTVVADAASNVKGYSIFPQVILPANDQGKLDVGGALGEGTLTVVKDMGLKEPYSGQVKLQTGEVGDDLTYYFAVSEQVPSSVGLGVLMNKDNTVACAGGFIIQLMPFASEEVISKLEENLKAIHSVTSMLRSGLTPEQMIEHILKDLEPEVTDTIPTRYLCNCSQEKVERMLISLGRKELQNIIDDDKDITVNCEFCGKNYTFMPEEVRTLKEKAQRD